MFTKIRDWDLDADGAFPASSLKLQEHTPVLMEGPKGEYFGYEQEDGTLRPLAVVTPNVEEAARREQRIESVSNRQAEMTSYKATYATLKAKRENGEDLTMADLNVLADLFFKIGLE